MGGGGWVGQPITDPISGPSFDFTFTFGPELDNFIQELYQSSKKVSYLKSHVDGKHLWNFTYHNAF